MSEEKRKSYTVWLKPRHIEMLESMEGVSLSEITRKSIEDTFEGRNERDFAKMILTEDISSAIEKWSDLLGLSSDFTITSTDDGFRVVVVALKQYNDKSVAAPSKPAAPKVQHRIDPKEKSSDLDEELDEWLDEN